MAKCTGKNAKGKPCRMAAGKSSAFCWAHDPARAADRARARKKGGQARHTPRAGDPTIIPEQIKTIQDAHKILEFLKDEYLVFDNSIKRNSALLALFYAFVKSMEIGEHEERLQALEARANGK